MSWLFGKKKVVPKVPFPEGKPFDENTLRFSKRFAGDKIIEPDDIKAAAGMSQSVFPEGDFNPEEMPWKKPGKGKFFSFPGFSKPMPQIPEPEIAGEPVQHLAEGPLFIKMDVYRQILEDVDDLRKKTSELQEINKILEKSEYNEETNFIKLNRAIKTMHDRLLQVDKKIFKA